jgi:hypothetical protein
MSPERWRQIDEQFLYGRAGCCSPYLPQGFGQSKMWLLYLGRLIPEQDAFAGPNPSVYAFSRFATQRNIYRVPVP